MDVDDVNEAASDAVADSTLESEIDALSKIIEESRDDQPENAGDEITVPVTESANSSGDIFSMPSITLDQPNKLLYNVAEEMEVDTEPVTQETSSPRIDAETDQVDQAITEKDSPQNVEPCDSSEQQQESTNDVSAIEPEAIDEPEKHSITADEENQQSPAETVPKSNEDIVDPATVQPSAPEETETSQILEDSEEKSMQEEEIEPATNDKIQSSEEREIIQPESTETQQFCETNQSAEGGPKEMLNMDEESGKQEFTEVSKMVPDQDDVEVTEDPTSKSQDLVEDVNETENTEEHCENSSELEEKIKQNSTESEELPDADEEPVTISEVENVNVEDTKPEDPEEPEENDPLRNEDTPMAVTPETEELPSEEVKTDDDEVFHTPPESVHEDENINKSESQDKKEEDQTIDKGIGEEEDHDMPLSCEVKEDEKNGEENLDQPEILHEDEEFTEKMESVSTPIFTSVDVEMAVDNEQKEDEAVPIVDAIPEEQTEDKREGEAMETILKDEDSTVEEDAKPQTQDSERELDSKAEIQDESEVSDLNVDPLRIESEEMGKEEETEIVDSNRMTEEVPSEEPLADENDLESAKVDLAASEVSEVEKDAKEVESVDESQEEEVCDFGDKEDVVENEESVEKPMLDNLEIPQSNEMEDNKDEVSIPMEVEPEIQPEMESEIQPEMEPEIQPEMEPEIQPELEPDMEKEPDDVSEMPTKLTLNDSDNATETNDETMDKLEMEQEPMENTENEADNLDMSSEKEDEGPDLNLTLEGGSEPGDDDIQIDPPKVRESEDFELESAVKFLQESEEKSMEADSTIVPKEIIDLSEPTDSTGVFVSVQDPSLCENSSDLTTESPETRDPIAISEAEIISEAAKLESEKMAKMIEQEQMIQENEASSTFVEEPANSPKPDGLLLMPTVARPNNPAVPPVVEIPKDEPHLPENVPSSSESVPQISVLEERLKEPPQIEIPNSSCDVPTLTPKSSLLIPRDVKNSSNPSQKPLESPRKDEADNIGSPRIILKIAKSALAECSEPRSPKSPKIRSATNSPNPEDSPGQKLGKIKLKLSKGGHPSIISNENVEDGAAGQWHADSSTSSLSPLGVKIKLSKFGDPSVVAPEKPHDVPEEKEKHKADEGKKVDTPSPIGMKIKLSKSGDASVIQADVKEDDRRRNESPIGMKIKLSKSGDAEIIPPESQKSRDKHDKSDEQPKRTESPIGMKIKLSKFGDPLIVQSDDHKESSKSKERQEDGPKRTDSPIGVKIKLSKTGDASIVEEIGSKDKSEVELPKRTESPIGVKIKLSKTGDASIVHPDKTDHAEHESRTKEKADIPKRTESPIGMKFKLSKTGDASIIPQDVSDDPKESPVKEKHEEPVKLKLKTMTPDREISKKDRMEARERRHKSKEPEIPLELKIKIHKQDGSSKRKDLTISPVETKKSKLENKFSQMLPEVTIQPVVSKEPHQIFIAEPTVIDPPVQILPQDISIAQETAQSSDTPMTDKLKNILGKQSAPSPSGSDCEIIEHRPELIIVNENSNSSQDVMIIEEVPAVKPLEQKIPKKRGRPRRSQVQPPPMPVPLSMRDPLALDDIPQPIQPAFEHRENERPRRTCRNQKSYAPPKRGRGRGGGGGGRGKRKIEPPVVVPTKKSRISQDLTVIEERTTSLITIDDSPVKVNQVEVVEIVETKIQTTKKAKMAARAARALQKKALKEEKALESRKAEDAASKEDGNKDTRQNWLTPLSKKAPLEKEPHAIPTVQVIDEETRMSAESGSRSQTPARNLAVPVSENILNEESQGSVLSTATTESEKVKVKNRRMEINFDPDEGPFTVDKIAEYEWPQDRKGETFMIQEQVSQYLGVKSFKRKYPDLKRRMVDMEERNYLRENGLVSEAMCDMGMGLTAIYSSEVLDVMCGDFPEQYEEYRKHMREKQVKEHSKKQKELSAVANAERNRIDLAEMAVQSAMSWNQKLNKSRQDSRKCSLDLQTFTIHVPQKKSVKIDPERRISYYPVALIPGQYTDYYREYTPAELRYYPLNTVLYGPMKPNERKFDSQSEGSQSDSDSDSSSGDDSSSSSSGGTQDTEESQSTMEEVDMELVVYKEETKNVKCKMCLKHLNKFNKSEVLIQCGTCTGHVHPSCIDLTLDMVPHIQAYAWQCTDCKTCAQCHDPADEDKMLFCDMCDRGYHIYCVGLRRVPQGRWHCQECAVCANCGTKEPAGVNADRHSVAQWQHEYKKGDKNIRVYVSTLCVPCSKLWRKGRYCPHCSRCHSAQRLDLESDLVHCSACDKYLHLDCVESKLGQIDRKNYLCDFCAPSRNLMPKSTLSKTLKSF